MECPFAPSGVSPPDDEAWLTAVVSQSELPVRLVDRLMRGGAFTSAARSREEREAPRRVPAGSLVCSRSQAKRLAARGDVLLNGKRHRVGAVQLAAGDIVSVRLPAAAEPPAPVPLLQQPTDSAVRIVRVLGDGEVVAWKPAGLKLRGCGRARGEFADASSDDFEARVQRAIGKPCIVAAGHVLPKAASGLVLLGLESGDDEPVDDARSGEPVAARTTSASARGCRDCDAGRQCLVTRAVLCGEVPPRCRLRGADGAAERGPLLVRRELTPSNRHGAISTVELHARRVPHQAWLQTCCDASGHPVANDPRLGRRCSVRGVRGMLMSRTVLTLARPNAGAGARDPEPASPAGAVRLVADEPSTFAKLRKCEARFAAARSSSSSSPSGGGGANATASADSEEVVSFAGIEVRAPPGVVMRPRDATALLVDLAVAQARALAASAGASPVMPLEVRCLDLGTGSGCVLLALLSRLWDACPEVVAYGVGVDRDARALEVAAGNAAALVRRCCRAGAEAAVSGDDGLRGGVALCRGSFADYGQAPEADAGRCVFAALCRRGAAAGAEVEQRAAAAAESPPPAFLLEPPHIVVCNPPYLDEKRCALDAAVRRRDPPAALFSGEGGLACYREIFANTSIGGVQGTHALLLELPGQRAEKVSAVLREVGRGWLEPVVHRDAKGMERVMAFEF